MLGQWQHPLCVTDYNHTSGLYKDFNINNVKLVLNDDDNDDEVVVVVVFVDKVWRPKLSR